MKLVQKVFLKGSREFEITDDAVFVRIRSFLREEKQTVDISMLDPEPVITGNELAFYSRYHGRPVLSLLVNNPSTESFNQFIDAIKQRVPSARTISESDQSTGSDNPTLGWNVYEEPAGFESAAQTTEKTAFQPLKPQRIESDIEMLKTYLDENEIRPLLEVLETLRAEPANEAAFEKMIEVYKQLGFQQGAVLTYAPYLKVLLSQYLGMN